MLPTPLPAGLPPTLLPTLLALLPTGVVYYTPVYAATGEVLDFQFAYLNAAAQRRLGLPPQPAATYLQQWPASAASGAFVFHREAFLSAVPTQLEEGCQADGYGTPSQLQACRVENGLLVTFTDTNAHPRSAVEEALRESQAREQAALAEVEAERQRLYDILQHLPALVATYQGPDHVYTFVNPSYQSYFPTLTQLPGHSIRQVMPEAKAQGVFALMDQVYQTGKPFQTQELEIWLDFTGRGEPPQQVFLNLLFHPLRDAQGQVTGLLDFSYDVTEQVKGRWQVQTLNEELAAINEELRASNEEYLAANTALSATQQQLQQLNQELEARVQQRTQQLEAQRGELQRLFEQAPFAIVVLRGPTFIIEQANTYAEAIWGRSAAEVLGRPHFEALPDSAGQGYEELLTGVLHSGQPLVLREVPIELARAHTGQPTIGYYDIVFKPLCDEHQHVSGIAVMWTEMTEQVLARQQVQGLNEELHASNEEYLHTNTALGQTQQQLRQLNQELESRVQQRTQQLAQQQGELQRVFEQAPNFIALYRGPRYTIELANETAARLFGRPRAHVLGRDLFEAVPELADQGYEQLLTNVLTTGNSYVAYSQPLQYERGGHLETTYWDFAFVPAHAADGHLDGVIAVANEVTAQVEARRTLEQLNQELEARVQQRTQQLEEQQQQLQAIFEQAPVAIFVLQGPRHVLRVVNQAMSEMLGPPAAALLGQSFEQALPAVAPQGYLDLLDQVWRTGEPVAVAESPARLPRHAPGETGYYTFLYHPLRDAHGQVTNIMCVAMDVTEQVVVRQQVQELNQELTATNEELHESNTRLLRTNADLDTFVYTASHDLKAPITNIEGILNALRETLPVAVQQEGVVAHLLGLLDNTVGRFQTTIFQLTDLSRLQQTYNEPAESLSLAPVVADALADLAPQVAAAQAQVHLAVPAGLQISFAPASLRSIVYNLLSNAIKYRDPARPTQVWLQAATQADQVVLTVRDNGLGLTEAQQLRLFGVFQRLHTHVEGTGVGLYMIKRLIDNAGATITVSSQLGVGSTFTVVFPA